MADRNAARALRRPQPLPAAASRLAGEEVGCDRGGDRLPRPRSRGVWQRRRAASASARAARASARRSTARCSICGSRSGFDRQIVDFEPDAIVAADPFIGAAALVGRRLAARPGTPLIVEVHGDWRTFTRGYGSPGPALPLARSPIASADTSCAARMPRAGSPGSRRDSSQACVVSLRRRRSRPTAISRRSSRSPSKPLPERPVAVFVGMLEAYKNIDGLAAAWRRVVGAGAGGAARDHREGHSASTSSTS